MIQDFQPSGCHQKGEEDEDEEDDLSCADKGSLDEDEEEDGHEADAEDEEEDEDEVEPGRKKFKLN